MAARNLTGSAQERIAQNQRKPLNLTAELDSIASEIEEIRGRVSSACETLRAQNIRGDTDVAVYLARHVNRPLEKVHEDLGKLGAQASV